MKRVWVEGSDVQPGDEVEMLGPKEQVPQPNETVLVVAKNGYWFGRLVGQPETTITGTKYNVSVDGRVPE